MASTCSGPDAAVVALFDDRGAAEAGVDALARAGFTGDHLGYVIRGSDAVAGGTITDAAGTKDTKGALIGALEGGMIGGILAAAVSVLVPPIGPVLVGGMLASFFGGAIAGTAVGGILGALRGLGGSTVLREQIPRGTGDRRRSRRAACRGGRRHPRKLRRAAYPLRAQESDRNPRRLQYAMIHEIPRSFPCDTARPQI